MVADHNEELIAEADILRQELGMLITGLRQFIQVVRDSNGDWSPREILEGIEEIIDG